MRILLSLISGLALTAHLVAARPSTARIDAYARAAGNRKSVAVQIGTALFRTIWPAQVLKVYADGIDGHVVAGLRLSGVEFHHPLTTRAFVDEVVDLTETAFATAPIEEIDVWVVVPVKVPRGAVVAGDLAEPTSRVVFTVSVHRGEGASALRRRIQHGAGIFWNQDWKQTAFKEGP